MMELNGAPRDRREKALGDLQLLSDEVISSILSLLTPRDVARLACVSSVMYIFCSEEPLWMSLCLKNAGGPFQYKGSWKRTLLHLENVQTDNEESHPRLHFDGFYSMFLYKRMYRCCTRLDGFYVDDGNVERKEDMTLEAFQLQYDGKKPVLINGLSDTWPARKTWTVQGLLESYGETLFKISQRNARKLTMKFKDYVSYMETQHDEDPLYIFDDKFGETAPSLLKDYDVPHLFREDFFDVLEREQRPPFRWLIIGPERSGASWHVDPALTSAWNTLLCGRKRWALYPPGRVPVGVTVHVNEEDGDVNIETPTSLQWWLDYYPLLPDEEKPIECTQLPGETIFVPSGWWHCVLNLENTIAVTQNFVNSKNFEYVCLDMAPGYRHKGICRAGFVALEEDSLDDMENPLCYDDDDDCFGSKKMPRKGKQKGLHKCSDADDTEPPESILRWNNAFPYEINFLSKFLDDDRDHYNSIWCSGNCIGQREMRDWLWKLWKAKPEMRDLIWKGACLALNAGKWLECVREICQFHSLPAPTEDDKLPIGTGSNPVYLIAGNVIKIYVEGGLESSLFGLGTELQFYNLVSEVECTLEDHIPDILTSGIIFRENGSHKIVPWDGKVLPDLLPNCSYVAQMDLKSSHFGVWSKKLYEYNTAKTQGYKSACLADSTQIWPYIITERCSGKIFAELRESLSWEDALNLASFLGEQLRNIHLLHLPPLTDLTRSSILPELESSLSVKATDVGVCESESESAIEWMLFVKILETRKKDVINRLTNWGNPIPVNLIEKVNEYLPEDFEQFLHIIKSKTCSWIHSDVMDDNIFMECLTESASDSCQRDRVLVNGSTVNGGGLSWKPSYIIDFSNLTIGDPLLDIIPIHLDVFRGDLRLLKQFLSSYKLPLWKKRMEDELAEEKSMRISYLTMCYCILHDDNVLGAIFSLWEELRNANSWEEVEEKVWGDLNGYASFA